MAKAKPDRAETSAADPVRRQYEAYPYPARNPEDEKKRLVTGSPSHLLEINHYVFGGRRDFSKPFRALVAGGGTGDGAIMLAQQLADAGASSGKTCGEVVYTDISAASKKIAEARAKVRGLNNITFHQMAIEELAGAGLGTFDYVDCCGVLHHLADPAAGLEALVGLTSPDGGLGLMVYGEVGRTGVYHFHAMMEALAPEAEPAERVRMAKQLLKGLPESNWFKRNPFVGDHKQNDAGLHDLLLNARDRAYRVPEIAELADGAGLAIASFIEPLRYDPAVYLGERALAAKLDGLGAIERAAFAELAAGNLTTHVFYAVPKARGDTVARPGPDAVPCLRDLDGAAWAREFKPGAAMTANFNGLQIRLPLPPLAGAMAARMDGAAALNGIHQALAANNVSLTWDKFEEQFGTLYRALNGTGKLYLRA